MVRKNNRFNFQTEAACEEEERTDRVFMDDIERNKRNQGGQTQNSENPGLILVSSLLTWENYLPWSKAIKRTLTAKEKLRFTLEDNLRPEEGTIEFNQWEKADCLVCSWILNSMTKDLCEDFLCAETARDLWSNILEKAMDHGCTKSREISAS